MMKLREFLQGLVSPFRLTALKENRHRILAMLTVYPLLALLLGSWFQAGAITLGCMALVDWTLRRYLNALAVRIEAKNSPMWDVELNQVKVGEVSDAEYAAIRYRVFTNARPYYAQAMNVLRVALNAFDYCYRAIPLAVFWLAVGLAVFSPETLSETVAAIQHATPGEVSKAVSAAGSVLMLLLVLVIGIHQVLGLSRFGFVNRFDEAIVTAVRQRCSVAAEGSLVLVRWTPDGAEFTDETAFLRKTNRSA